MLTEVQSDTIMLDNFEYTFFDKGIAEKFAAILTEKQYTTLISHDLSLSGEDTFDVKIKEPLDDNAVKSIESIYDDMLFGEQAAQFEDNSEEGVVADSCGVQVQLQNGDFTTIAIHPTIMNKILSVLTIEELQKFLAQAAADIENPKNGPVCSRENKPTL